MHSSSSSKLHLVALAAAALCLGLAGQLAQAGQGCPFDDGSCQTYCNQQGCNFGYCGHFAWIQCICRKCGDEWNWYDKVHYNPDKAVNQTELDSLKLNGSAPIILSASQQQQQRVASVAPSTPAGNRRAAAGNTKGATLTTLLIPDLSDATKLDLNDIPDENSEKFLDFLAKNHEKLAQATGKQQLAPASGGEMAPSGAAGNAPDNEGEGEEEQQAEETVEIQISSSNNQQPAGAGQTMAPAKRQEDEGEEDERGGGGESDEGNRRAGGQVARLLRMAVHEQLAADLSR